MADPSATTPCFLPGVIGRGGGRGLLWPPSRLSLPGANLRAGWAGDAGDFSSCARDAVAGVGDLLPCASSALDHGRLNRSDGAVARWVLEGGFAWSARADRSRTAVCAAAVVGLSRACRQDPDDADNAAKIRQHVPASRAPSPVLGEHPFRGMPPHRRSQVSSRRPVPNV